MILSGSIIESIDKSLKVIAECLTKKNDDYWHPAKYGADACTPGREYTYVLVRERALGNNMEPIGSISPIPQIARFDWSSLTWVHEFTNKHYETEDVPFEVVYWRPIHDNL